MSRTADIKSDLGHLVAEHGMPNAFHTGELNVPPSTQRRIGRLGAIAFSVNGEHYSATYASGWWSVARVEASP